MKNIIDFPNRDAIFETAALWLVRMDDGGLVDSEVAEFRAWLAESPVHAEVFRETLTTWEGVSSLQTLSKYFPLEILESGRQRDARSGSNGKGWRLPLSVAAAFVLIGSMVVAYVMMNSGIHRTAIGERTTVHLPDGSEMSLNTDSELKVSFDEHIRRIDLTRGEAFFEVVKDPQRPFVVVSEGNVVTAVGTAFSVFNQGGAVRVVVSEGVVQLQSSAVSEVKDKAHKSESEPEEGFQAPVYLEQGQVGIFSSAQLDVQAISAQKIEQKLSWRESMLVFDGEPLTDVIAEFQRYTATRLIVDDSVRDIRVGGYFRSDDIQGMLASIQSNFGVEIVRLDGDRILLKTTE